jgi:HlyD family secretion protein
MDGLEGELEGRIRQIAAEPVFTPYFALNQSDRGHLTYVAKVDILDERAKAFKPGTPLKMPLKTFKKERPSE